MEITSVNRSNNQVNVTLDWLLFSKLYSNSLYTCSSFSGFFPLLLELLFLSFVFFPCKSFKYYNFLWQRDYMDEVANGAARVGQAKTNEKLLRLQDPRVSKTLKKTTALLRSLIKKCDVWMYQFYVMNMFAWLYFVITDNPAYYS